MHFLPVGSDRQWRIIRDTIDFNDVKKARGRFCSVVNVHFEIVWLFFTLMACILYYYHFMIRVIIIAYIILSL